MKKLIFILMFVVMIGLVNADQPPTYIFTGDKGLQIEAPAYNFYEKNTDNELIVHVYNETDGLQLNNLTHPSLINCNVMVFDRNGTIKFTQNAEGINDYFRFNMSKKYFSVVGEYSYTIHCNISNAGGYLTNYFIVTEGNHDPERNYTPSFIVVVFFTLLLIISVIMFARSESLAGQATFGLLSGLFVMVNIMYLYLIFQIMNLTPMMDLLEPAYHLSVISVKYGFYVVVAIMLYTVINLFFNKKNKGSGMDKEELGEL